MCIDRAASKHSHSVATQTGEFSSFNFLHHPVHDFKMNTGGPKKISKVKKNLYDHIARGRASESPDRSDPQSKTSRVKKNLYNHIAQGRASESPERGPSSSGKRTQSQSPNRLDAQKKTSRVKKNLYDHITRGRASESPERGPFSGNKRPQSQSPAASGDESETKTWKPYQRKKKNLGDRIQDPGEKSSGDERGRQFQKIRPDDPIQEASEAEEEDSDDQQNKRLPKKNKPLGRRLPGPGEQASGSDVERENENSKPDDQEGPSDGKDSDLKKKKSREKKEGFPRKVTIKDQGVKQDTSVDVEMGDAGDVEQGDSPNEKDAMDAMLGIVPIVSTDPPKPPRKKPTTRRGQREEDEESEMSEGGEGEDADKEEEGEGPDEEGTKKIFFTPATRSELPRGYKILNPDGTENVEAKDEGSEEHVFIIEDPESEGGRRQILDGSKKPRKPETSPFSEVAEASESEEDDSESEEEGDSLVSLDERRRRLQKDETVPTKDIKPELRVVNAAIAQQRRNGFRGSNSVKEAIAAAANEEVRSKWPDIALCTFKVLFYIGKAAFILFLNQGVTTVDNAMGGGLGILADGTLDLVSAAAKGREGAAEKKRRLVEEGYEALRKLTGKKEEEKKEVERIPKTQAELEEDEKNARLTREAWARSGQRQPPTNAEVAEAKRIMEAVRNGTVTKADYDSLAAQIAKHSATGNKPTGEELEKYNQTKQREEEIAEAKRIRNEKRRAKATAADSKMLAELITNSSPSGKKPTAEELGKYKQTPEEMLKEYNKFKVTVALQIKEEHIKQEEKDKKKK